MTRIVISEFMDAQAVDWLKERATVVYDPALVDRPDDLAAEVTGAAALVVRNRTQVRGDLLARFASSGGRVVGRLGVGLDNIDQEACADADIRVIPATGANATAVAEYVVAAALMLVRGAYRATEAVLDGTWPRQQLVGGELSGRTMGLVGFGMIARLVADRAVALGMDVVAHDPFLADVDPAWATHGTRCVTLSDLLAQSDVVSLHLPLTETTRGLIDPDALAAMKPHAILINTARGGIVDEPSLAAALADSRLGGAAMDVFANEPLAAGSALARAPNLLATPHIAGVTGESNRRVSWMIAEAVWTALDNPTASEPEPPGASPGGTEPPDARVICVGSVTLDQIYRVPAPATEPVKHFASDYREQIGGSAAVAAVTVSRLGGEAVLWSRVGADAPGNAVLGALREAEVDTTGIIPLAAARTTTSAVLVTPDGERTIVNHADPTLDTAESAPPVDAVDLGDTPTVLLADSRWPDGALAAMQWARTHGVAIVLDADATPAPIPEEIYRRAHHIVFSAGGLAQVMGSGDDAEQLRAAQQRFGGLVAVTRGAHGTLWYDGTALHVVPAPAIDPVETLGAGDVFHGAYALALADGQSVTEAFAWANKVAAIRCTRTGGIDAIPARADVDAWSEST